MKVAYLIVTRSFPGLLKQVETDRTYLQGLDGIEWDHFTFLDKADGSGGAERLPPFCRGVFGRKLFAWLWLLRHSRRYDYVIVRHMEFDPFALIFAWFVRNRISVHHSKEVIELRLIRRGWQGTAASLLERVSGFVAVRTAKAVLGVTREVCEYQRTSRKLSAAFPIGLYPNGVVVDAMPLLDDTRANDVIEIAFLCGTFSAWHGLDLLLDRLQPYLSKSDSLPVKLHLIGRLTPDQLEQVTQVNTAAGAEVVVVHGVLPRDAYLGVLARCHIGLGSLAMERIQMREGATLKVREMLALGLPVYSGHVDTALPDGFPYYLNAEVDIEQMVEFARMMATTSRRSVRDASRPYVDKRVWVEQLGEFLRRLKQDE